MCGKRQKRRRSVQGLFHKFISSLLLLSFLLLITCNTIPTLRLVPSAWTPLQQIWKEEQGGGRGEEGEEAGRCNCSLMDSEVQDGPRPASSVYICVTHVQRQLKQRHDVTALVWNQLDTFFR